MYFQSWFISRAATHLLIASPSHKRLFEKLYVNVSQNISTQWSKWFNGFTDFIIVLLHQTHHSFLGGGENLCFLCFTSSWAVIVGVGYKDIWIINQILCTHLRQSNIMHVIYTVYHSVMFVFHSGLTTVSQFPLLSVEAEVIALATGSSLPTS